MDHSCGENNPKLAENIGPHNVLGHHKYKNPWNRRG